VSSRWSPLRRLTGTVPGELAIVLLGCCYTAVSIWNLWHELQSLSSLVGPILAGVANVGFSLALFGIGIWLARSDLSPERRWAVAGWCIAGSALALGVEGFTVAVRLFEGRTVSEPQFSLIVVGSLGGVFGALIGKYAVDARSEADRARETTDAMAFTNSLLRHDVLNGLQIMRGHAEIVEETDDQTVAASGEALSRQVDTLTELVQEVRSVSETLLGEAETEPIDLVPLLDDAVAAAAGGDDAATIEVDLPESLVAAGTPALTPVFRNLLNNAVQHTGEGVEIRVVGTAGPDTVTVAIADDGPGVPPAERERIFERGVTGDGGDGGLGLHIVATILERIGGAISVSESDLGGARFEVTLPKADEKAKPADEQRPFG
jgi:signal transduction histidine kinase